MKPARFDYARPPTLAEALALLAQPEAAVLAGGQSLMPMMNLRVARPALLVDINRLPLGGITLAQGVLHIGALARHAEVLASPLVAQAAPLLPQALAQVAHAAIRNRGTLGGSLALADPAAELPACMLALDATLVAASAARGERRIPAGAFFHGLYSTALAPDEVLLRAELPAAAPGWRFAFLEVARRHGDFAMAGLSLARGPGAARLALCGVEAGQRRHAAAEAALIAGDTAAALAALGSVDAMDSPDLPAAQRLHLAQVLLRRALQQIEAADAAA
jgi:carbon-monoxide dehydrogenase medium subunit